MRMLLRVVIFLGTIIIELVLIVWSHLKMYFLHRCAKVVKVVVDL